MPMLNSHEATQFSITAGVNKANFPFKKAFLLGILGGMFIGLGGLGSILASNVLGPIGKFIGAFMFPVGLIMTSLVGGSIFTGNCLLGAAYFTKEISLKVYVKDLIICWFGNLVGAIFLSFLVVNAKFFTTPAFIDYTVHAAYNRTTLTFLEGVFSGFLCNVLVAGAVWLAYTAKDALGKIIACWFPVMLFVFLGFQHVVANMTYLFVAKFLQPDIFTIGQMITTNFIPVTIGNFLSGGIFLPLMYITIYKKAK